MVNARAARCAEEQAFMKGGATLQSLSGNATAFLGWWRDELLGLVPEQAHRLFARRQPEVVLAQLGAGFAIVNSATSGADNSVLSRDEAMARLADIGRSKAANAIGIRLPVSLCFVRHAELPLGARRDLRQILDVDLERATPFKLRDVYAAHLVDGEGTGKGKLRVRQFIIKRDAVDPLIAEVKAAGLDVAFVDCWDGQPAVGLPINLIEPRASAAGGMGRVLTPVRVLAALAVLLAVSAFAVMLWKYESALADLQAQVGQARTEAAAVRRVLDRSDAAVADLGRLQSMKLKQIPAIEVLEEVTRILPDTVWLIDFRIEGDVLDMSGLAKAGAALPPLFERSSILADGALSAPLTFDPREDKERFSLRVRIKQRTATRETSAAGKQD
jgi:general secretion pathway protein L